MMINVAVVLLPLHDPVQLAEEMSVLDIISGGRVTYVAAIGYRPVEYEMFGVDYHRRGKIADEKLSILLKAKTGEPFDHDGRRIHVTPPPLTPGGPMVATGAGAASPPPAAPAATASASSPRAAARSCRPPTRSLTRRRPRARHVPDPRPGLRPDPFRRRRPRPRHGRSSAPTSCTTSAATRSWNEGNTDTASLSFAGSAEELRAENKSHRIVTVDEAVAMVRGGVPLPLHPLIGGLPPEIAWRYLETVANEVMPALQV